MTRRNTRSSTTARRNTTDAGVKRNTSQLVAFPTSKNQRERQSARTMCVVSIRLLGATVATLDRLASEASQMDRRPGARRYRMTRSELIGLAIDELIKRRDRK